MASGQLRVITVGGQPTTVVSGPEHQLSAVPPTLPDLTMEDEGLQNRLVANSITNYLRKSIAPPMRRMAFLALHCVKYGTIRFALREGRRSSTLFP